MSKSYEVTLYRSANPSFMSVEIEATSKDEAIAKAKAYAEANPDDWIESDFDGDEITVGDVWSDGNLEND